MTINNHLYPPITKFAILSFIILAFAATTYGQYFMVDIKRDSARSDKITGGTIERADFLAGEGGLKLTINIPAFQMFLWQNGKEVRNYPIGVGLKDYPMYVGKRKIKHVIWNPVWIPPDSSWVAPSLRGKIIKPTDPRNPLGKIKIPLGYGYLLHQAKGTRDLGNLVSHGCARVLRKDLYDLSEKIVAAQSLAVTPQQISTAKRTKRTFVIELADPMPIEITYDTMVVKAGKLHIYPDVYGYKKNKVELLREELRTNGIEESDISDEILAEMADRAKSKKKYVISVENVKAGNYLEGEVKPVLE